MPGEAARASDPATGPALLPEWLVLSSLTLPGRPDQVSAARRFVARTIGCEDPRSETLLLLTSELVTNAIVHSRSGQPGGTIHLVLAKNPGGLLVTVTDNGSRASVPAIRKSQGDFGCGHGSAGGNGSGKGEGIDDGGNGLILVEQLADAWGYLHDEARTTVWFRLHAHQAQRPGRQGACS